MKNKNELVLNLTPAQNKALQDFYFAHVGPEYSFIGGAIAAQPDMDAHKILFEALSPFKACVIQVAARIADFIERNRRGSHTEKYAGREILHIE